MRHVSRSGAFITGVLMAALVGGCGIIGENATAVVVAPGKFDHFNCDQLATTGDSISKRERELTELMARAQESELGQFVGAVSYRTELVQARGHLKQIGNAMAQKNCVTQAKWQSDRALW